EDDVSIYQALIEEGELPHVCDQLQRRLGERGQVDALPALPGQVEDDLERKQGLSRARLAGDQVDGSGGEAPSEDAVEVGAPCREQLQVGLVLGHRPSKLERGLPALAATESARCGGPRLAPSFPPAAAEARRPTRATRPACTRPSRREPAAVRRYIPRRSARLGARRAPGCGALPAARRAARASPWR